MGREYKRIDGPFDATPLSRSLRAKVANFKPIVCLMELIDNSITATMHRTDPLIEVEFDFDSRELRVEDNGTGMCRQHLQNYFRDSFTTSRVPQINRDAHPGVLPLQHFIDRRLSRYGAGSAASVYFGDVVEIESFKAPTSPNEPALAYKLRFNYGAQEKGRTYDVELYETVLVDEEEDGWTIIRIQDMLSRVEKELNGVAAMGQLARQLAQAYHFFVYGFPEGLWRKLPPEYTYGGRPMGGVCISLRAVRDGKTFFEVHLDGSKPASSGPYTSDLYLMLQEYDAQLAANRLLRPCVTQMRYLPPGQAPPSFPSQPSTAATPVPTRTPAPVATNSSGMNPHPPPLGSSTTSGLMPPPPPPNGRGGYKPTTAGGPSGAIANRSTAGGGGSSGGGGGACNGGGGRSGVDRDVICIVEEESDIGSREVDVECTFTLITLYFPYSSSTRTKPLGQDENQTELYTFPCWSGKVMLKSKLTGQFPHLLKELAGLAKGDQETQSHVYKLDDPARWVALLFVTPDGQAHQHKSDFEGRAYELFCKAGASAGVNYIPTHPSEPRLLTYWSTPENDTMPTWPGGAAGGGDG